MTWPFWIRPSRPQPSRSRTSWPQSSWPQSSWPQSSWPQSSWPRSSWPRSSWPRSSLPRLSWHSPLHLACHILSSLCLNGLLGDSMRHHFLACRLPLFLSTHHHFPTLSHLVSVPLEALWSSTLPLLKGYYCMSLSQMPLGKSAWREPLGHLCLSSSFPSVRMSTHRRLPWWPLFWAWHLSRNPLSRWQTSKTDQEREPLQPFDPKMLMTDWDDLYSHRSRQTGTNCHGSVVWGLQRRLA